MISFLSINSSVPYKAPINIIPKDSFTLLKDNQVQLHTILNSSVL